MSVHRNPRRRKLSAIQHGPTLRRMLEDFRKPVVFGIALNENPNDGYRKPSNPPRFRLTEDGTPQPLRTIPRQD